MEVLVFVCLCDQVSFSNGNAEREAIVPKTNFTFRFSLKGSGNSKHAVLCNVKYQSTTKICDIFAKSG